MYHIALYLIAVCSLFNFSLTRTVGHQFLRESSRGKITTGLRCGNVAGVSFCNGTNELYDNSTMILASDAQMLQRKMLRQSNNARNGYEPCPHGQNIGCTIMESIVIPTFITNSMGQPRYIYQNKHLGITQQIHLSVCRSKQCGGYNKCQENLHPVGLIAINPHRPHQLIVDTFIIPGCCSCEIPWINPGGPEVVLPPPSYGQGFNPKPPRPPFNPFPSPPNLEYPNPDEPHFVMKDSRMSFILMSIVLAIILNQAHSQYNQNSGYNYGRGPGYGNGYGGGYGYQQNRWRPGYNYYNYGNRWRPGGGWRPGG
uniref:Spaetzle domain-containing protein n=1 Tax=Strigamia maritima TaxID=126957 RepID=T1JBV1_STRMM